MNKLEVFKDEKVLITGNTGFKGSWLSVWLNTLGADVSGFSLEPPTKPNMYEALALNNIVHQYYGDVRDKIRFEAVVDMVQPKFVFHLAAQPIVKLSYEQPQLTFETNAIGTLNLLESCKPVKSIESVVVITTDKVYESIFPYEYCEFSPLGGDEDPYSISKACAELIVNLYRKYYRDNNVSLATVRAGNVLGGGDWSPNRIVPDIVKSIEGNYELSIYLPDAIRPWQFVLDCLYGYMLVGANRRNGAYNFGPSSSNCVIVEKLVKKFISQWGKGKYNIVPKDFPESKCLKLKAQKAREELGWVAQYGVDSIIQKSVEWYKTFYEHPKDLYSITLKQISEYEELIK